MLRTILITFVLLWILGLSAETIYQCNVGMEMPGTMYSSSNTIPDEDTRLGYSMAAEILKPVEENLLIGLGVEYQFLRGYEKNDAYQGDRFSYIPIYATGRLCITKSLFFAPELIGNVGVALLTGNETFTQYPTFTPDLYWSLGAGISLTGGLTFEALWKNCNAYAKTETMVINSSVVAGMEQKLTQKNLTFSLGYRF